MSLNVLSLFMVWTEKYNEENQQVQGDKCGEH